MGQEPDNTPKALAKRMDVHVGKVIHEYRIGMRLTQAELAERIEVSFQQVQKYESGKNRVSAGKLYLIALALGLTDDQGRPDLNYFTREFEWEGIAPPQPSGGTQNLDVAITDFVKNIPKEFRGVARSLLGVLRAHVKSERPQAAGKPTDPDAPKAG